MKSICNLLSKKNMHPKKQFNYYEWFNHPQKDKIKVVNGMGLECTGITDALKDHLKPGYLIVGYFKAANLLVSYTDDGRLRADLPHGYMHSDLYMILPESEPEKNLQVVVSHSHLTGKYDALTTQSDAEFKKAIDSIQRKQDRIVAIVKLKD
jgi:hypothetical protein